MYRSCFNKFNTFLIKLTKFILGKLFIKYTIKIIIKLDNNIPKIPLKLFSLYLLFFYNKGIT